MAGASATPVRAPAGDRSAIVSPIALGARSILDFLPERLADAVREHRNTVDLAPFINRAIAEIDAGSKGGTLYFPAGTYAISSIDLTQTRNSEAGLTLIGAGRGQTTLRAAAPGQVLIDAAGRNNLSLLDLEVLSADHVSTCGLLLARHIARPECSRNRIANVRFRGAFAVAAAVSVAAESNSWAGCFFENGHAPTHHGCFLTINDPATLRMSGLATQITAGPNTDNTMIDCEFYAPFDGARPVRFVGSAGYTMLACTVIAGSASRAQLVTYSPLQSIFSGPVTWQSPHLEVFGQGAVVHCLSGTGTCYYRGVNSYGGSYQVADGTLLMGQAPGVEGRPIVQSTIWTVPLVSQGVTGLGIRVYGLTDCNLAIRNGEDPAGRGIGDIEVTGFAANSRVIAGTARIAQKVTSAACI